MSKFRIKIERKEDKPVIDVWMSDHNISIDGDGQNIEDRHAQETISEKRIESTQLRSPDPMSGEELGCRQRKIETTKQQVGHRQIYDENCCSIANL